jgi:mono/diheme cytochrome c family protein
MRSRRRQSVHREKRRPRAHCPGMRSRRLWAVFVSLALAVAACGRSAGGTVAATRELSDAERMQGRQMFEALCATCHGPQGQGDGPGSATLDPKPRNFSSAEWQSSVTDAHIRDVIAMGGAAVGKSPMMPAQPQLKSTPRVLEALVAHVRSFGAKPAH